MNTNSMRNCVWRPMAALILLLATSALRAQTTQPVTDPDPIKAINLLRTDMVDSFNKGDVDRLLSHVDTDVVVTWQNGEVCRGPQSVRAYYDKMMSGPSPIVSKLSVAPVVEDRHIYGDWAVSWGNLGDEYVLSDGSSFKFDSRFTATVARRGEVWKVTSFHASVNAFDNPIIKLAEKKVGIWVGVGGAVMGLLVGGIIGVVIARRKRSKA